MKSGTEVSKESGKGLRHNSKAALLSSTKRASIVKNTNSSIRIEGNHFTEDEVYNLMEKAELRYQASRK